jgi:chromosomal replication initiator protein
MEHATDVWTKICGELQRTVSPDAFKRWFLSAEPVSWDGHCMVLGVENAISQYWIEENYLQDLRSAASIALNTDAHFRLEVCSNGHHAPVTVTEDVKPEAANGKAPVKGGFDEIDSRYTFETFVVGANNQFAHAAAVAVADSPGTTYNPLFIHGPTGLGKTHLMHAIGARILQRRKSARIVYVTSEQFTNEFIAAIQYGQLIQFRKRFRQADVLLIDDIQFLAGKDRSQEEFFHTFNTLSDGQKQIVLTSDRPPSETENLQQRLVSRFEWGLNAGLDAPDIETRLAILKQKAEKMNIRLGDAVMVFIAERVKANVRRLEGALVRVAAWAALHDRKITQPQIEELLKDFIHQEAKQAITVDLIKQRVADSFNIRLSDMTSKRRPANIAVPRMVAMYLSKRITQKSLQEIGDSFGGRDHGTVIHACKAIEERMGKDENFRNTIEQIHRKLESPVA